MRLPLSDLLKGILISYNIALCNLVPVALRLITYFELLNQLYVAELELQ